MASLLQHSRCLPCVNTSARTLVQRHFTATLIQVSLKSQNPHLANDKDVAEPGSEGVACGIFDVHNVKGAWVTLPVSDHTNASQVSTTSYHAQVA